MIRNDWRTLILGGLLFLFLASPLAGAEGETPGAVQKQPAEPVTPPEEVAEILRMRELLELMELLQDLDVLAQSEQSEEEK
jgi:hypothetical protein